MVASCLINNRFSMHSTARGSSAGLCRIGPAKVKASNFFLGGGVNFALLSTLAQKSGSMKNGQNWGTWMRKLACMKTDQTLGTWTRFWNARRFLSGKRNPLCVPSYTISSPNYLQIFSLQCPVPNIQIQTHTSPGDRQPSAGLPASRWWTV